MGEVPLTRDERRRVVVEWNATRRAYPRDATIHGLIREQASRRPDALALSFGDRRMTYRELDELSSRVASGLRRLGVRRGSRVGISTQRSIEQIVGLVGILKAGGSYVPFDPAYPAERLAMLAQDADVAYALDPAGSLAVPAAVRVLDTKALMAEPLCGDEASDRGDARDEAHVLFTSGSTGRPKGVCIAHRGAVRLVRGTDWATFGADDVFLSYATLAFDASTLEIWGALINGGALVIAPPGVLGIDELGALIRDAGVTFLFLTTGLFHLFVDEDIRSLEGVRQVVAGGDVLSPVHAQRVLRHVPGIKVINGYGPTENSCLTTAHIVEIQPDGASIPIGKPIAQTTVYVLDEHGEPAPIGVAGELFTGGDGVARGYLDARMTAERFVPDPFSDEPGSRLYRTGDMARWRNDGTLEFLGRRDGQVKVRGFRVEVREIETAILRAGGVREAIVIVRDDSSVGKQLVGYLIAAAAPLDVDALRGTLARSLPAFMVPSAFVVMESFPLTSIGKIDRAALPAPSVAAKSTFVEPEGRVETAIADVFATTLRVPRIGALDDFLDLGGHSLTAAAICSRLRATLGIRVDLRTVFDARTPRALAARVASIAHDARPEQIPRVDRGRALPLTSQEARLWFLHSFDARAPTYNECAALRVAGPLDHAALARAFARLEERHEALRTRYATEGEQPVRIVLPPSTPRVEHLTVADADAAARAIRDRSRAAYHLDAGRLWRPIVVDLADGDHIVALAMHHIITDEWSIHVVLDDLQRFYRSEASGEPEGLEDRPFELADWAAAQGDPEGASRAARDVAHFVERLEGVEPVELPLDRPRPTLQSFDGKRLHRTLPDSLRLRVKAFAQEEGATVSAVLLAMFGIFVHRHTGARRFAVAVPIAGRAHPGLERVAGFFVNTVAVDFDFSERRTVREVVRRTKEALLDSQTHGEAPFDRVVDAVVRTRDQRRPPLCQVAFAPQPPEATIRTFAGHRASPFAVDVGTAKYDLAIDVVEREDGIDVDVEYATSIFTEETAARMSARYELLLGCEDFDVPVAYVPLMTAAERATLDRWNDTTAAEPDRRLHEMFDAQAARTPDAIALTYEGTALTYRELDEQSNQLARFLMRLGVTVDSLVGISMERSPELVIGILGILKAGAAYAPLDPENPRERLAFMLEDSGVPIVLTQARVREKLPQRADCRVIAIDEQRPTIAAEPATSPRVKPPASALAYVIYTSGSTGKPKAAMNTHAAIANSLAWQQRTYPLTAADRVLHKTAIGFDLSIWECLWPLLAGARVVLAKAGAQQDLTYQIDLITREGVTFLQMTPSELSVLIDMPGFDDWGGTIRHVETGGEAISLELQERFFSTSRAALANGYGPSECAVVVTGCMCERGSAHGTVPIGKPLSNVEIYIVDSNFELVPVGVPGELCVGGIGVGRGYHRRPNLTADKFVPDPFSGDIGARLYRTGDLARYMPDGNIEYLGRIDHQAKLRGFRIELGEIEAALGAHASVKSTIVVVREDAPGDKRLVAYVVWNEGGGSVADLRAALAGRLPPYMVPAAFVELDALPVTPNGKIDRRALPAPTFEAARDTYVAPRTPLEEQLAAIWCDLLRVPRVGARDNFFELGGHSLSATQLVARLKRLLHIEVPVRSVFEAPVLEALAERLLELQLAHLPPEELAQLLGA